MDHKEVGDFIAAAIVKDGRCTIRGFGSFILADTPERIGRHIQTGEIINIPAGRRVKFKAAPRLKAAINGDKDA